MEAQICKHFDITEDQIVSFRDTGESIVVVINNGIAGCPKYTVSKSDLPEIETKPEPVKKAPAKKRASKKKAE